MDKNKKTIEAYDKNPQFYADKFDSYGVRFEDIDRAIKLNESGSDRVLELGCGNGRDAQYIISKVGISNYKGVDASSGLLNMAQKKNPGADFKLADARNFTVSPETFGIVFAFSFLVHINIDELAIILDKCHKSLKKGGILYIFSSKYGDYQEKRTVNLGDEKFYYYYKIEDIEKMIPYKFFIIYKDIQDIEGGRTFTVVLRKI
ncbi:MAG: class I SAM-dependent methyltransferase [bacterium]